MTQSISILMMIVEINTVKLAQANAFLLRKFIKVTLVTKTEKSLHFDLNNIKLGRLYFFTFLIIRSKK